MRAESPNLDLIRSIAVLAVIARHLLGAFGIDHLGLFPVQLLGIFGVMLFFVHTAHVLMFSLERMRVTEPAGLYGRFLVRRAFRIYPLSGLVVLLGFALTRFSPVPGFATLSLGDMVANLFLVQNLTRSPDAIGVLWSLPLEVQMYLFLPALFLILKGRSIAAAAGVYAVGLLLALSAFLLPLPEVFRFFPCFLPGVLAYALIDRGAARNLPFWALPAALLAAWVMYEFTGQWSQTVGAYPACVLVGIVIPFVRESSTAWLNTICHHIAKYSYGIYIVHGVVLSILYASPTIGLLRFGGFFVITCGASWLAFHWVEDPMVALGKALTSRPETAALAKGSRIGPV